MVKPTGFTSLKEQDPRTEPASCVFETQREGTVLSHLIAAGLAQVSSPWRNQPMAITEQAIDQAFSDARKTTGGVRNDYFGILYLEQEMGVDREEARSQIAFGGNDYGIDGFHFDREKRNLYLYQFKWSNSH